MKNTSSPDSKIPNLKLSPEMVRFIESVGMYFESYGIPRIGGRILGLLQVASEPLSADNIASFLKVSRASVSTNFRLLLTSGMAEKVTFPGDRTTYYTFPETAWEKIMSAEVAGIMAMKKLAEQGLSALSSDDAAHTRMQEMINWAEFLAEMYQRGLAEWRERQG